MRALYLSSWSSLLLLLVMIKHRCSSTDRIQLFFKRQGMLYSLYTLHPWFPYLLRIFHKILKMRDGFLGSWSIGTIILYMAWVPLTTPFTCRRSSATLITLFIFLTFKAPQRCGDVLFYPFRLWARGLKKSLVFEFCEHFIHMRNFNCF